MGSKGVKLTTDSANSAEDLQQRLAPLGDIRTRKMFGGFGVFEADTMFALVDSSGGIFFKADESNLNRFEEAGSEKHARMPYYQLPEAVLDDDKYLQEWALASIQVAKAAK